MMLYEEDTTATKPKYTIKCPHCTTQLMIEQDRDDPKPDDLLSCTFHGIIGTRLAVLHAVKNGELEMVKDESSNFDGGNTSGARQRLINAQEDAINNPSFRPGYDKETHCNQATIAVAKALGAPTRPFLNAQGEPLLANQIAQNLLSVMSGYHTVSPQQAQQIANRGGFVIATGAGLGHVETVSPDTGQNLSGSGPVIGMVGSFNGIVRFSKTFTRKDQPNVKFYTPN